MGKKKIEKVVVINHYRYLKFRSIVRPLFVYVKSETSATDVLCCELLCCFAVSVVLIHYSLFSIGCSFCCENAESCFPVSGSEFSEPANREKPQNRKCHDRYKTCKIKKQILHIHPELSIQLYRYRLYCMYSVGLLLYSRV